MKATPINLHTLSKILSTIQLSTSVIKFQTIILRLKQHHIFKYPLQNIQQISINQIMDNFVLNCYRFTMTKLLYDMIINAQNNINLNLNNGKCIGEYFKMIQKLDQFTINIKIIIKQNYCKMMELIVDKKSQNVQFIIFLVCFSVKNVISMLCQNYDILKIYFQSKLQKHSDQIASLACTIINYQITGIIIRKSVYKSLKLKYYKKTLRQIRSHKKILNQLEMSSAFKYFMTPILGMNIHNENRKQIMEFQIEKQINNLKLDQVTPQQRQFVSQIRQVFSQRSSNIFSNFIKVENQPNPIQTKTTRKQTQSSVTSSDRMSTFAIFQNKPSKVIRYSSLRNSQAFKQRRDKCYQLKSKKMIECTTSVDFKKKNQNSMTTLRNKKSSNKLGLTLIGANLNFLFAKNQKKCAVKQVEKPSVAGWKKRIHHIQQQTNIQRAKLIVPGQKWKNTRSSQEQFDRNSDYSKHFSALNTATRTPLTKHQSQRPNMLRTGFCQFIDQRQSNQIGIVKNIVNFPGKGTDDKQKKIYSKGMKQEYEQFVKRMEDNYQNFMDENNFAFRLQKVLTGANRL